MIGASSYYALGSLTTTYTAEQQGYHPLKHCMIVMSISDFTTIKGRLEAARENHVNYKHLRGIGDNRECMRQANRQFAMQPNKHHLLPLHSLWVTRSFLAPKTFHLNINLPNMRLSSLVPILSFVVWNVIKLDLCSTVHTSLIICHGPAIMTCKAPSKLTEPAQSVSFGCEHMLVLFSIFLFFIFLLSSFACGQHLNSASPHMASHCISASPMAPAL